MRSWILRSTSAAVPYPFEHDFAMTEGCDQPSTSRRNTEDLCLFVSVVTLRTRHGEPQAAAHARVAGCSGRISGATRIGGPLRLDLTHRSRRAGFAAHEGR